METLGMVLAIAIIAFNIVGIVWLGIELEHIFLVPLGYIIGLIIIGNINETACIVVALVVAAITLIVIIVKIVKAIVDDIAIKRWQKKKARRDSDLLDAVNMGDNDAVQKLIENGADVNYIGYINLTNKSILQIAIENSDKEMVSLLIEKGADVNFVYEGRTPLDCAKDEEIIALLKSRGAKTKSELDEAKKERCKLIDACKWGHLNEAKSLIESGFDLEVRDEDGKTALILVINAVSSADFVTSILETDDIAKLLIQYGAEIDARDNKGRTASMYSAMNIWQHLPLLIESGADVNAKDKEGTTVLMWACVNTAKIAKPVEFLISKGADVNARENSNGETALMSAAFVGNVEAVLALIKNGADVNANAYNGATALSTAIVHGHIEIENILRSSGAYR